MSTPHNDQAYECIWLIRRLFRAMATRADQYLAESGLSAADRAVMEFLYMNDPLSVPEIARRYEVSRQHIQVTVNALMEKGLLRTSENPHHKRSRLLQLSSQGHDCFEKIRRNESAVIQEMFSGISNKSLATTQTTLASLLQELS